MFIHEKKLAGLFGFLRSPVAIALLAMAGCVVMMVALIDDPLTARVTSISTPVTPGLAETGSTIFSGPSVAFAALLGGFAVMSVGGFALSRRGIRDALKAEGKRSGRDRVQY